MCPYTQYLGYSPSDLFSLHYELREKMIRQHGSRKVISGGCYFFCSGFGLDPKTHSPSKMLRSTVAIRALGRRACSNVATVAPFPMPKSNIDKAQHADGQIKTYHEVAYPVSPNLPVPPLLNPLISSGSHGWHTLHSFPIRCRGTDRRGSYHHGGRRHGILRRR